MTSGLDLGVEQDLFTGESSEFPRDLLFQVPPFTCQIEDDFGVVC